MSEQIAHVVFFTLHESTAETRAALVASCDKHLSDHDGVLYYSAGQRGAHFNRPVNDQAFDVALHVVFRSQADHDQYQQHPRHQAFIAENKATWQAVRVFDSVIR